MVEVINVSLEPVNYTKVKVLWNTGKENINPMNNLTNEDCKVNTQEKCKNYGPLLIR